MRPRSELQKTSSDRTGLRQLLASLLDLQVDSKAGTKRGRLLLESLEPRQMMAGDVDLWATDGLLDETPLAGESSSASGTLAVTTQAEGEAAPDLVQFAKDLTAAGVKFFGAHWCPACTQQKQLFSDGGDNLPFIEVTNPDRTRNQIGIDEGITQYPTWEFPDSSREVGVLDLATLSSRSGVAIPQSEIPTFETIGDQQVRIGSPLHIPVDAYDPDGGPLTVTISVDDPSLVEATVISGNRSLRLNMEGFGDMVFELFEQRAPRPAGRVADLADAGFYDGIIFHRVIDNFVIQAGDPTGTGTSGSGLGEFDDQFHPDLQHNRSGILSFAKTADDTNNSQFFVTENPTRHLDFHHSIFGQLVEGEDVREAISNMEVNGSDQPTTPITISSASVFTDTENSVIMLKAIGGTGQTDVTVTVTDQDGNSHSETFEVEVVADNANSQPFLDDIPEPAAVDQDTTATLQLASTDIEGDAVNYFGSVQSGNATASVNSSTGVVSVTPASGFVGDVEVLVGVAAASSSSNDADTQLVSFSFEEVQVATPGSLNLTSSSDSGTSSTDDLTNLDELTFTISGVTSGNTVEIINTADDSVIGQTTAGSTTATITTSSLASLADGTYTLAARQSSGTVTSNLSATLSITLDRTDPATALASISERANVGVDYGVDFSHPEEGNGLVYGLTSAPSGASIDPGTGEIQWVPTQAQLGIQNFTLELTDRAGNTRAEAFTVSVAETPLAEIQLEVTDLQGNPIDSIEAGEEFLLRMFGVDNRPDDAEDPADELHGVFGAHADILFDGTLVAASGSSPIEYASGFNLTQSGTTSSGLIDELGATRAGLTPTFQERTLIASVRMQALATGNVEFRSEVADAEDSDVLLYLRNAAIDPDRVIYNTEALAIGQAFTVADDDLNLTEDSGPRVVDVLANDQVVSSSNSLSVLSVTQPADGGSVSLDSGTVTFTPDADFFGTTTFSYRVRDTNDVEGEGTVTVTVTNVNDAPTGVADQFEVNEGTAENPLDVLANDSFAPDANETLTITAVSTPSEGGTVTIVNNGQELEYTPPGGFSGTDSFTYTVSDGQLSSEVNVSVIVAPADPPPTANPDAFDVVEDDTEAEFDVLANDTTDASNESFVIDSVGQPSQGGNVRISSDGTKLFYTPDADFEGTEEVRYTIRDTGGGLALTTVTFTVQGVNDPPPVTDQTVTVNRADGEQRVFGLQDLPENVDAGESLNFTGTGTTAEGGTVRISSDESSIFYTAPSTAFVGDDSFTYTVTDTSGETSTATLTITVVDFQRRTISLRSSGNSFHHFSGVRLLGTDALGNQVEQSLAIGNDTMEFADLLPGEYTVQIPAIPFLQSASEPREIAVSSQIADGDVEVEAEVGRLRPEYLSIRDWLGSTPQQTILAVVAPGESAIFTAPTSAVANIRGAVVEMDNAGQGLTVRGTDTSGADLVSTVSLNQNPAVQTRGTAGPLRLLRINVSNDGGIFEGSQSGSASASAASNQASAQAADAASSSLVAGGFGEGESQALQAITRADVFTPVDSEDDPLQTTFAHSELSNSRPREGAAANEREQATDRAMPDVSEQLSVSSRTGDFLAERGSLASNLHDDAVDAVIGDR